MNTNQDYNQINRLSREDMAKHLNEIRLETKRDLNNATYYWHKLSSQTNNSLKQTILTINTLLLSITFVAISSKELVLNINSKHLLLASWILIMISIIFAVIDYYIEYNFYKKYAISENKREQLYSEDIYFSILKNPSSAAEIMNKISSKSQNIANNLSDHTTSFIHNNHVLFGFLGYVLTLLAFIPVVFR